MSSRRALGAGVAVLAAVLVVWGLQADRRTTVPATSPSAPSAPVPQPTLAIDPARSGAGELTGRVVSADGSPVADADVDVVFATTGVVPTECPGMVEGCSCGDPLEPTLLRLKGVFAPLKETTSGNDGRFVLRGLPAGVRLRLRATDAFFYATSEVEAAGVPGELKLSSPLHRGLSFSNLDGGSVAGAWAVAIEAGKVIDCSAAAETGSVLVFAPATASVWGFAPGRAASRPDDSDLATVVLPDGGAGPELLSIWVAPGIMVPGSLQALDGTPSANVHLKAVTGAGILKTCATATSASDGSYRIGPLSEGWFRVDARSANLRTGFLISSDDFADRPDASVSSQLHEEIVVRGSVLNSGGQPIAGARVRLVGGSGASTERVVDGDGRFEIRELPGSCFLSALAPGYFDAHLRRVLAEKENWDVVVSLLSEVAISGRVEDASRRPLPNQSISVMYSREQLLQWHSEAVSLADGSFSVKVPEGDVEIVCSPPGFKSVRFKGHAPQKDVLLIASPGARVDGRVLDEHGAPVEKVTVVLKMANRDDPVSVVSGRDGEFRFDHLDEGRAEVTAIDYGRTGERSSVARRSAHEIVDVGGSPGQVLELRLASVAVHGRVVDEQGVGQAGITVRALLGRPPTDVPRPGASLGNLINRQSMWRQLTLLPQAQGPSVVSGADGSFILAGLTTTHYLLAEGEGVRQDPASPPVFVNPGEERVVVTVLRERYLTADVTSSKGLPISSVTLDGVPVEAPGGHLVFAIPFAFTGRVILGAPGHLPLPKDVQLSLRADTSLGAVELVVKQ